ncbi:MAG: hypothetical protein AAGD10_11995 [Myxococcota bacterium]
MKGLGSLPLRRRLWARLRARRVEPIWAGLAASRRADIQCWVELRNESKTAAAFDVPASALLALAEGPLRIRAWLHVHPHGQGRLSARDRASALLDGVPAWPGVEWVVLGPDGSGTRNLPVEAGFQTRPFTHFCGSAEG